MAAAGAPGTEHLKSQVSRKLLRGEYRGTSKAIYLFFLPSFSWNVFQNSMEKGPCYLARPITPDVKVLV
nr:hypothetical protein [Candidatus Sigynarchaeota archaeon]